MDPQSRKQRLPPPPNNIGKRRKHVGIDGRVIWTTVDDEVHLRQATSKNVKLIYFQKIRFEQKPRLQYRFTYYMLGLKPGPRQGCWIFGQFSLFIPPKDLTRLLGTARKRGWPGV